MNEHTIVTLFALAMLCIIEVAALMHGIDGAGLAAVLTILGYAIGYKHKARKSGART
jgi:hypothetical protein